MTDPVADFLIRIKNAYMAGNKEFSVPFSDLKKRLGELLVEQKYITSIEEEGETPVERVLIVRLKYHGREPAVKNIRRISKPSLRTYLKAKDIRTSARKFSVQIISTPEGLMTANEAKKKSLGGEVICQIW